MWRILILGLVPLFAIASEPRLDLYKQIKKETGVSLKEAYQAVEQGNHSAATDLQIYARRVGIKTIEQSFEEEISYRTQLCKKRKSLSCDQAVSDLKSQLESIRSMQADFNKLSKYKRLYFCLVVYHFNIKFKVLRADLEDWNTNCSSQEKINTLPCQEKLYETHTFADVANDLAQLALTKSENSKSSEEQRRSIRDRISRYEKM